MITSLQIGTAIIKLQTSLKSKRMLNFLNQLLLKKGKSVDGIIKLRVDKQRRLNLNPKLKLLELTAPDIENLHDPFVTIGLLQVLFRFANFCVQDKPYLLLHGSTASIEGNKSILFGDNGKNLGKTSAAVEIGLLSKKFVVDEFSFYDVENNQIFGYSWVPIHIREHLINHLNSKYNFNFKPQTCLIKPSSLGFKLPKENQLSMIVYPNYRPTTKVKVKYLSRKKTYDNLEILSTSQLVKLLHPSFDRMNWFSRSDKDKIFDIREFCHQTAKKVKPYIDQVNQKVSSYEIIYNNLYQVSNLVKEAIKQEKNKVIEHKSASSVIYLIENGEIKIVLLKKKNGPWVLPKGHIEENELPEKAALREAQEETGLENGRIIKLLQKNFYTFKPKYGFARHKKTVILYLVKAGRISFKPLEHEGFEKVKAFAGIDAVKVAFYDSEKTAIKKALKIIKV